MTFTVQTSTAQRLQNQVRGAVLKPDDSLYEQARRGWNLTIDQHPALILVVNDAQDVATGVRFAREQGLGAAVQLTGHGIQQPADGHLLIVTSRMNAVDVNPEARTVRVEAGVIWQQVLDKTTAYGLAPLLGTAPHIGVVGYTLSGGIGWLARRYGFASDSVRWIDLVTADGVLRRASPTENGDLFWGLRGGGGNFGVVTAMEFNLYPVATIYGGSLVYPPEIAGEALRFYRDWIRTVPDDLTSSIGVYRFPPLPALPEAIRGKTVVLLRGAFAGDAAKGEALIRDWLDWKTPVSNTFREMPFSEVGTISNQPVAPMPGFGASEAFNELVDDAINVIVRYAVNPASPLSFVELRHTGGAIAKVAEDTSAMSNRDALLYLAINAIAPTSQAYQAIEGYAGQFRDALRPYLQGGLWLNFTLGSEMRKRSRDFYSQETYQRLIALKAKYDPDNLFRFSHRLAASEEGEG
jgi:FAD/FMN-containing dehydrogenase